MCVGIIPAHTAVPQIPAILEGCFEGFLVLVVTMNSASAPYEKARRPRISYPKASGLMGGGRMPAEADGVIQVVPLPNPKQNG